jgi:anti-anti-sigma factor
MLPGADSRVIVLAGELDTHDARDISARLSQAVGDISRTPVVDARQVTFLDSTVLAALAHACEQLRNQGRTLTLAVADDGAVRALLDESGLADRFELVSALPETAPGSMPDPAAAA